MTRTITLMLLLASPAWALAQGPIVLNNLANGPQPGQSYTVYNFNPDDFDPALPGMAGEEQTWDFSALPEDGTEVTIGYLLPIATPNGDQFPDSEVAIQDPNLQTDYLEVNDDEVLLHGAYEVALNVVVAYDEPVTQFVFPCTYGTTWSDQLNATYTAFGQSVTRSGSVTGLADGYGTLVMPYGTFEDVLRVRVEWNMLNQSILSVEQNYVYYLYYRDWMRIPMVRVEERAIGTPGSEPEPVSTVQWLDADFTSIAEAEQELTFDLFPNPADGQVQLQHGSGRDLLVELFDGQGRLVLSERLGARGVGMHRHDLSIEGFSPGIYLVRMTDAGGARGTQRLVVQ